MAKNPTMLFYDAGAMADWPTGQAEPAFSPALSPDEPVVMLDELVKDCHSGTM